MTYTKKVGQAKDAEQSQKTEQSTMTMAQRKVDGARANYVNDNRPTAKAAIQRQAQMANSPVQAKPIVQAKQIAPAQTNPSTLPIQRYTASEDGQYFVSENSQFAVAREAYPNSILMNGAAPMALPGGLKWNNAGEQDVDDVAFTQYQADISDYEAENGPGSAKFCGQFARGLAGELPTEDQSTAEPGGVLYDRNTTPEGDDGWENHYASVVKKDGGDHATFETAVGIDHVWAGIYGSQRGQTFKYKTQQANIDRLIAMPDSIIPAEYRTRKGFWDYVFCRPGRRVKTRDEIIVPRGITMEQGEIWKNEMEAWRANGTPPESSYMKAVVQKLEAELQQLSGEE